MTFKKASKSYRKIYSHYMRKKKRLSGELQQLFEKKLLELYQAIDTKDKPKAKELAKELQSLEVKYLPKQAFEKFIELIGSIVVALALALVIRQMWFELYRIPTGSMRPTLKEGDYLTVSKNTYGLNVPFTPFHFYFNPELVKRGAITVFSIDNMDVADPDTMYFYLIPGKKQLVKRLIAKPGDTLYFYGGEIYGFDQKGKAIQNYRSEPWFKEIEHIPFIHFDGKVKLKKSSDAFPTAYFYQMNEPVAKLGVDPTGQVEGKVLYSPNIGDYYDLWGLRNFAMARILDQKQMESIHGSSPKDKAPLYLELTHHPSLSPGQVMRDAYGRMRPDFSYSTSFIPLYGRHLKQLMNHMTTSRFMVKNGKAIEYGYDDQFSIPMKGVPDGTYEFIDGTLYEVGVGSVLHALSESHPLKEFSYDHVQTLYNLGIDFKSFFKPSFAHQPFVPSRYAYFKEGALFLLGAEIYSAEDKVLQNFIAKEKARSNTPFIDYGPPVKSDGSLDHPFIEQFGLKMPEKSYLLLGDNYANSGDSRVFGFVPEDNLKGKVSFLFWPPSNRWGIPFQPTFPWVTVPRIITWVIFLSALGIYLHFHRKKWKKPPKF